MKGKNKFTTSQINLRSLQFNGERSKRRDFKQRHSRSLAQCYDDWTFEARRGVNNSPDDSPWRLERHRNCFRCSATITVGKRTAMASTLMLTAAKVAEARSAKRYSGEYSTTAASKSRTTSTAAHASRWLLNIAWVTKLREIVEVPSTNFVRRVDRRPLTCWRQFIGTRLLMLVRLTRSAGVNEVALPSSG